MIAPILAAGAVAATRFFDVVEVRGRSMAPTLAPGDRLLVVRLPPRVGDVVLAADPRGGGRELVKRVTSIVRGRVTLSGDNPAASTDGRTFGSIPVGDVGWRAVWRYWPLERAGRLAEAPSIEEGGEPACAVPEALIAGN
jgi:signal peptidase I